MEALVREVVAWFEDGRARTETIGSFAERLGEHPWRIVDAIDVAEMLGYEVRVRR